VTREHRRVPWRRRSILRHVVEGCVLGFVIPLFFLVAPLFSLFWTDSELDSHDSEGTEEKKEESK